VPAALLERRPDVRAARLMVEASDARASAALRARFPALTLQGSLGFAGVQPTQLLENFVWTFVVGVTQTLFDGGRRGAEVDRARAQFEEQVARYGETLLTALVEVENALASERRQRAHLEHLRLQEEQAGRALADARAGYVGGVTDFLQVLTALQAQQRVEQTRLAGERQLLSYRVGLHRALGGTWTRALAAPVSKLSHEEKNR
jgi:outer membrane protein TolC